MYEKPLCRSCNKYPVKLSGNKAKDGRPVFKTLCSRCNTRKYGKSVYKYRRSKGPVCTLCGFVPVHSCQLDVDHIDGNHKNNDASNLQTLCANCHRLKTRNDRLAKIG